MGGYEFMVVLWIIFIIVGLFRIRDDYRDFIKTKEKMIISLGTKLSMFTFGFEQTIPVEFVPFIRFFFWSFWIITISRWVISGRHFYQ